MHYYYFFTMYVVCISFMLYGQLCLKTEIFVIVIVIWQTPNPAGIINSIVRYRYKLVQAEMQSAAYTLWRL